MNFDQRRPAWAVRLACIAAGSIAAASVLAAPAQAQDPATVPGSGSSSGVPALAPSPGQPNFAPPRLNPASGETVGVAQPVVISFDAPVKDHATAERAIRITSTPVVSGHFYWFGDKQVRWRPEQFWPANTDVTVQAGASTSTYHVGDEFTATADDATHMITVTRNGQVVRTMKTSMGKKGHETPNGTYFVSDRLEKMIMDSATYGVPNDGPEGYKLEVHYATRIANNGIFIHAAPWSLRQQGHSDTSHGCLNVSDDDAKWYMENAKKGDPVIVKNSAGPTLNGYDGLGDWNLS